MTNNNMKPCPFCGGHAVFELRLDCSIIRCVNRNNGCPVNMRTHKVATFAEAQAAWNTRTDETGGKLMEALREIAEQDIAFTPQSKAAYQMQKTARAALAAVEGE